MAEDFLTWYDSIVGISGQLPNIMKGMSDIELETYAGAVEMIEDLSTRFSNLHVQYLAIEKKRRYARTVGLLPPEILSYIFDLATSGDLRNATSISHISRAWREQALNTPRMWTHITFREVPSATDYVTAILERTGAQPLDITFRRSANWADRPRDAWSYERVPREAVDILRQTSFRWRKVNIVGWVDFEILDGLSTPNLEIFFNDNPDPGLDVIPFKDLERLQSITGVDPGCFVCSMPKLKHIEARLDPSNVGVLHCCPNVQSAKFQILGFSPSSIARVQNPGIVTLSYLHDLHLTTEITSPESFVLRGLSLPNLTSLTLRSGAITMWLLADIRFSNIQSLTLVGPRSIYVGQTPTHILLSTPNVSMITLIDIQGLELTIFLATVEANPLTQLRAIKFERCGGTSVQRVRTLVSILPPLSLDLVDCSFTDEDSAVLIRHDDREVSELSELGQFGILYRGHHA